MTIKEGQTIFVVGVPRSGTTLLQAILTTHPSIISIPETHVFRFIDDFKWKDVSRTDQDERRQLVERVSTRMPGLIGAANKTDLLSMTGEVALHTFVRQLFLKLALQYNPTYSDQHILLEKTPAHLLHLSTIKQLFPKSKIVHIVRFPPDVISSVQDSFGKVNSLIARSRLWKKGIEHGVKLKRRLPEDLYEIKYEDIVEGPECLVDLFQWLGLDFEEANLMSLSEKYRGLALRHETWKSDRQADQIENRRDKWKERMKVEEAWFLSCLLRKEMQYWGYEPVETHFYRKMDIIVKEIFRTSRYYLFEKSRK